MAGRRVSVSVIVNNFNYDAFLQEAIESALHQSCRPLEVIVVDDGSTDRSREIIEAYGTHVHAIFKENAGQAPTFNAGFASCRGDVVVFLDADDALLPSAVESTLTYFEDPDVVTVHWPLWLIDRDGKRTGEILPRNPLAEGDLHGLMIRDGPDSYQGAPTSGNAWSRAFLSRVLPAPEADYRNGADGYLLTLAPLFGIIRRVAEPGGFYRIHDRNHFWTAAVDERNRRSLLRYERRARTLQHQLRHMGIEPDLDDWKRRNAYYQWMYRLDLATEQLLAMIRPGQTYLLVDDNQWGTQLLTDRTAIPFPEQNGLYAGPPRDDEEAIREFERLRGTGPAFIVFGWPGFWWLDHYSGFRAYLDARFRRVLQNDRLIVFDLQQRIGE